MIIVENTAYNFAFERGGDFIVKPITAPWGWGGSSCRILWIEVLKNFNDTTNYSVFQYDKIKIYIHKDLKVSDNIHISKKPVYSDIGSLFNIEGVSISL